MGWGRFLLLGNIGQQLDIEDQRVAITQARMAALRLKHAMTRSTEERFTALQSECDELKLFVAALLRTLVAKGVATQEEVVALVESIDAEDGVVDGKSAEALPKRRSKAAVVPKPAAKSAAPSSSLRPPSWRDRKKR